MQKINNLSVFTFGNRSNQSIIFVHGFPFDASMWNKQTAALQENYFCICYDLKGLGSSLTNDGQLTMESFVDDLFSIINELKIEKPILCGLSMGGYISLRGIEREQEKFNSLILFDTRSDADSNQAKLKRAAAIKSINENGSEKFIEEFVPHCFGNNFKENFKEEYYSIIAKAKTNNKIGVKGCLLAMMGRTSTSEFLPQIKIPTLIFCGEEDALTPVNEMKIMAEKIQSSKFIVVPNSGHLPPIENPDFVNNLLKDFLFNLK